MAPHDTALHDPARHVALAGDPWDEGRARAAITGIVERTLRERVAAGHWPVHPRDLEGEAPQSGYKSLYLGSGGVWWALAYLQRVGALSGASSSVFGGVPLPDARAGLEQALAAYRVEPDTDGVVPSYFLGEVGLLLALWRLGGSSEVADRLHAAITANIPNPTNEALWAAPGTMVAAWHLWEATHEERWRRLFLDNVEQVWRTWLYDEKAQCHLWTQDMYGRVVQYLGAGHGFVGNCYALLKGAALLDAERRATLHDRIVVMLRTFARRDGDAVNWPPGTFAPRPGAPACLMQWCHGAPGFVTALADFPRGHSAEFETFLLAAGEATWRAGPLEKGHGLCHGTAGNGYAFLKLFQRSSEARWLERARAFAMFAIGQCERMQQTHGQGRHSLWTGDPGLAVYLWHCIDGTAAMPALDIV